MLNEWLKQALATSGMSQAELSRRLTEKVGRNIDHAAVNKMVSGKRAIAGDELLAIAELTQVNLPLGSTEMTVVPVEEPVGLPIIGTVAAGSWVETSLLDDSVEPEMLQIPRDPRFPAARQYALWVSGDSMNLRYPHGTCVTCVDFAETGLPLRAKMVVHVERYRFDGQEVENTLKLVERQNGGFVLVPLSTNTKYQPIYLNGDSHESVVVKGLVTGSWQRTEI